MSAVQGGQQYRDWTQDTYLTAALIDAVRENTHAFISANSKRKPAPLKPVSRPSATQKKNPATSKFATLARLAHNAGKKKKE